MGAYLDLQRAIIYDGHKLILYPKTGVARLYDLRRDPDEMADLAGRPEHAQRKADLLQRFTKLQQELGDDLKLGSAYTGQ